MKEELLITSHAFPRYPMNTFGQPTQYQLAVSGVPKIFIYLFGNP